MVGTSEHTVLIGSRRIPLRDLETTIERAAEWFYWVAGLALVDYCVTEFTGWSTQTGLGITQLARAHARPDSLGITLLAAACLAGLGYFARRSAVWAFAVGYVAYTLDAAFLIKGQAWIALAFHVPPMLVFVGGLWLAIVVKTGHTNPVLWGGRTARKRRRLQAEHLSRRQ
jgi:hypothetical protein